MLDGFGIKSFFQQGSAKVALLGVAVRIERNGLLILRERSVEIALFKEDVAEVVMGHP